MTEDSQISLEDIDQKCAFIEVILFVSGEPVEPQRLMEYLDCKDVNDFEQIIDMMNSNYDKSNRGIVLKRSGGGFQLTSKPDMHDLLTDFFSKKVYSRLSIPSLETLSIVAYRQPVTIAEISELRGVNSISPVRNLLQKKLIKISGRKRFPADHSSIQLPGSFCSTLAWATSMNYPPLKN